MEFCLAFRCAGGENLRLVEGGAVTVCNHVHHGLHHGQRWRCSLIFVRYLSLRRNLELPFTGWLLKACGCLPIPEHPIQMARLQREMEKGIAQGEWIHYYPEGECWCGTTTESVHFTMELFDGGAGALPSYPHEDCLCKATRHPRPVAA